MASRFTSASGSVGGVSASTGGIPGATPRTRPKRAMRTRPGCARAPPPVSGIKVPAATETRIVRPDAVHLEGASFPDAGPVGLDAHACLKEAFSGKERYKLPAVAECVLLRTTQLEPEPGKSAARPVILPRRRRVGELRASGRGTSGTRVVDVVVVVVV